jgi:uncharacterized protein
MSGMPVINGREFAERGALLEGSEALSGFARLCSLEVLADRSARLSYRVQGGRDREGRTGLRIRVAAELKLVCQRCLEPMDFELAVDAWLGLAQSQAEIDADPVTADMPERVLAGSSMPVAELVEDEALLAMPYAPRHEKCRGGAAAGDSPGDSPFGKLRALLQRDASGARRNQTEEGV